MKRKSAKLELAEDSDDNTFQMEEEMEDIQENYKRVKRVHVHYKCSHFQWNWGPLNI